jgi:uncharacterized spore protein YtfJ
MALEDVVKQIAETLEREGNARAVFGEPMKLETKTLIPVAVIGLGGGGALGGAPDSSKVMKAIFSGGGGGGFNVRPVGFIHERDGEVVYTPIHIDVRNKPFLNEASSGLGRAIDAVSGVMTGYATRVLHLKDGKSEAHARN